MLTLAARPLRIIHWKTNEEKWRQIENLLSEWTPAAVVVGIPRHVDGTENSMTKPCERFANQIEGRYGLPVIREDERFSSVEAQREAEKNENIDDEAAAIILQQWLSRKDKK